MSRVSAWVFRDQMWPFDQIPDHLDWSSLYLSSSTIGLKWRLNHRAGWVFKNEYNLTNVSVFLWGGKDLEWSHKNHNSALFSLPKKHFICHSILRVHNKLFHMVIRHHFNYPAGLNQTDPPHRATDKSVWKPKAPSSTLKIEIRISFNSGSSCSTQRPNSIPFLLLRFYMFGHNNTRHVSLRC